MNSGLLANRTNSFFESQFHHTQKKNCRVTLIHSSRQKCVVVMDGSFDSGGVGFVCLCDEFDTKKNHIGKDDWTPQKDVWTNMHQD